MSVVLSRPVTGMISPSTTGSRRLDRDAVHDAVPVLVGLAPFGVLIGATIGQLGINPGVGLASAALFFAGSAHLAALTLIGAGAGPLAVVATVAIVNSRLMLYGAAVQSRFQGQPGWFRWLAPHLLVDQTYASTMARPELVDPRRFRRYWLTVGGLVLTGWLAANLVGVLVGPGRLEHSALDVAAPAMFIGLLVPQLRSRPAAVAAAVGAVVAAVASPLPGGAGLVLGALAGIAAAAFVDRSSQT